MTTPTERAEDVLAKAGVEHAQLRHHYAQALNDAGLLAAPVDGELREALLDQLVMSPLSDTAGTSTIPFKQTVDQLLPRIAAHLAEEKRKAAEKAWDEGALYVEDGQPRAYYDELLGNNPYRLGGE